ncbi:ATP-dependent DNA ligase LigD phosphoesterase module /ATP-dependent DNA ligase LigD polymerase module [Polaromonas sp. YR568]|uniref:DNA ligase D n=1 Tax=Polaromonas sp. YR568 TaxID=1855301 RepID=UPI0008ED2D83|nr:DNA ligase D [Polaromonas sp. YR568]SFU27997.1 ATP-dependent DNA ligase LigD phosphoesterase module /ATP-dependent DNA ligase LigD polymerase module [Polaromonas sp. YR568]
MGARDLLKTYQAKRDFTRTPEPARGGARSDKALSFVIQKHDARNLHYDFRLELQGTLKSWAVPKGPSLDPGVKRMGVHVEDHPLSYAGFEGSIPAKQYGAGDVIVWDRGLWTPLGDPVKGLKSGKLKFELHGEKLKGGWTLVRMHGRGSEDHEPWLLIKEQDEHARTEKEFDVLKALPNSVLSGNPLPRDAPAAPGKKARTKAAATKNNDIPEGATKAKLPETLAPQLATLVTRPPADPEGWVYEIKYDGYRMLARIEGSSVRLFTRNGNDWTSKLPKLAKAVAALKLPSGWIDGEIVVMNEHGVPDFGALQNAFDRASTASIVYYVFDLPFFDGLDLRQLPLSQRREILCTLATRHPQDSIRFSDAFEAAPQDLLDSARRVGLEGVIGKRVDSSYVSSRSPNWIKLKTQLRQEFVIGGYTAPKGSRTGLGALMLGVHDNEGKLQYAGNVGTGFNDKTLGTLTARLEKLHTDRSPFARLPAGVKGQWVKPRLLAEVAFGEWTHSGHIRHSVFQGLRTDKPATHILREKPAVLANQKGATMPPAKKTSDEKPAAKGSLKPATKAPAKPVPAALKSLRVTHADRVIDASTGLTKQNVVEHYASVASLMLPHLKARPTSLVRAPSGIAGELFFQKHAEATSIPGIKLLDPKLDPGHAPLLEVPTAAALLAATQVNVIEFHTWNATTRSIHKPDRMTFDLDPGEGVGWPQVQEAAQLVHAFLDELGLASFLKTSGGKGLHVVVPLKRQYDFDTVKDFSHAVVMHLAAVIPQRFVAKSGPKNRVGKIFADYLRNGFGATTVSAWSLRARPGMGVSVPVAWDELASLTGGAHWTAQTLGARLTAGNQPWHAYEASRNSLTSAMKRLGFKPPRAGTSRKP